MTKTTLSALKTGDKFSFDSKGRYRAIFDHMGNTYFAWKWISNRFFEDIRKSQHDCEVWKH